MMPKRATSGDDAAEEWLTPRNNPKSNWRILLIFQRAPLPKDQAFQFTDQRSAATLEGLLNQPSDAAYQIGLNLFHAVIYNFLSFDHT